MALYCDSREGFSPTELGTVISCPRKWFFRYIQKVKTPKSTALAFGTAFHEVLDGKGVGEVDISALPEGRDWRFILGSMASQYFSIVDNERCYKKEAWVKGGGFLGRVDSIYLDGSFWWIKEDKTCSDIDEDKYRMIDSNLQVIGYNAHAKILADSVGLDMETYAGIMYTQSKKPNANLKDLTKFKPQTEVWWLKKQELGDSVSRWSRQKGFANMLMELTMAKFASRKNVEDIPCCEENCVGKYGRCDFFDFCHGKIPQTQTTVEGDEWL